MTYAEAIVQLLVQLSPTFLVVCFVFILFSWIRVLVDKMSGSGM